MNFGIKNNTSSGVSLNTVNSLNSSSGDNSQQQQGNSQNIEQQFQGVNQQHGQAVQQNRQVMQEQGYQNQPYQQQGYPNQQQGYPNQQQGYPNQQQGYPNQQQGYPNQQQGYPNQQQGYPNQQQGYPNQQQGQQMQQGYQQVSQPKKRPAATGVNLKKGQKVSLSKMTNNLDNVLVGLGWDISSHTSIQHDLDVEVFMLDGNNKILGDDWFVFYNKLMSPDGSVKHSGDNTSGIGEGDDEVVTVQLSKVDPNVKRLAFIVTINDAIQRGHNFGQIKNAYIRIADMNSGKELIRFNLTDYYSNVISMVVGEIYNHNGEWKFNPVGDGTSDDLTGLCVRYGVNVQ